MSRFGLGIALAFALLAPAYAAGRFAPGATPNIAAGQVAADGHVVQGLGFQVKHVGAGQYRLKFEPGIFQGCVNVIVTPVADGSISQLVVPATRQYTCGTPLFDIELWVPGTTTTEDHDFQFVAVQV